MSLDLAEWRFFQEGTEEYDCNEELFEEDLNGFQCTGLEEGAQYAQDELACLEGCCNTAGCEVYQFCPAGETCVQDQNNPQGECWLGKLGSCYKSTGWLS